MLKIKKVQKIKSGIWEIKGGKYTKTLAKIQARRIFRTQIYRDLYGDVMLGPNWMSTNKADGNQ